MKIKYQYLFSLLSFALVILSAGVGPDAASRYGNSTGETGWNGTQNALEYYFNSDSGLSRFAAGGVEEGHGEDISADSLVEEITFLADNPE